MSLEVPHPGVYLGIGRVRRQVWGVLAAALLLALLMPLAVLWHATALPLRARACVWPAVPRADTTTYLIVALPDPADRSAVAGPWAQVRVSSDMPTMPMGKHPVVAAGSPQADDAAASFAIPLHLDMAGPWQITVTMQTPGRPAWQSLVQVTVTPPLASTAASPAANMSSVAVYQVPCAPNASNALSTSSTA